ncbi:uncharacterized protein EDB93DRAFT_1243476 [Suillus bovinus]|uniref:uncharacterized protein n=1 Tax=Suillus bovinus TaxID=48563 RepID=UPI001B884CA3|nr:uncharacterized protein EDB93DRAFT_1243476 [Suillus bovinus]KAG2129062.1 hypothetical protein EDB93DRAFT_1243476 [Suillus bovinus]
MSSTTCVARVAYLASDIIVDSQPILPSTSQFAKEYSSLSATSSRRPTILSVPLGGDPGSTLIRNGSAAGLISFTSSAAAQTVTRLVLDAAELSSLPLVLHLAVTNDLSEVLLLHSALPFFFVSRTPQQAHDNSLLASRLARTEKAVVHVFYDAKNSPVEVIPESEVQPFLLSEKLASTNGGNGHNGVNVSPGSELFKLYERAALSTVVRIRRACPPLSVHGSGEPHTIIFGLGDIPFADIDGVSVVSFSLLTPLLPSRILDVIPPSVSRVIILEQLHRWNTKWTPLYLELVNIIHQQDVDQRPHIQSVYFSDPAQVTPLAILKLLQAAPSSAPIQLGGISASSNLLLEVPHVPKHESSYTKILSHVFGERFEVSNSPDLVLKQGAIATSPEFAVGRVRGQLDQRNELIRSVQKLLEIKEVTPELHKLCSQWVLVRDDDSKSRSVGKELITALESSKFSSPIIDRILSLRSHFPTRSRWIIGSDAWSYDLGASGLHHAIASDAGLYAMNHGNVYVAILQAVMEADRHKGPSVVLAYLPYQNEDAPALEVLKETKLAVDAGYWPLYRWDPVKEAQGKEPFALDSDAVKNDLQQFLDRQNHLSQLVRSKPELATELVSSLGENVKEARKRKAQQAYDDLVVSLDAPPLVVLYASDGGTAEKFAKRLANRGKARGLSTSIGTIDSMSIDTLSQEEYVAFVTSVAGQGEPPQNGRTLFKALNAAALRGEKPFSKLRYSVFALGDSHYWPRPEDAHYYNKPGKDLDARLEQLGGERFADIGLGDDQDADGPDTGYKVWEPLVWKTFGVDSIEVKEAEPDPITNEHIKAASGYLRGTIAEGLEDTSSGALDPSDTQLTKFHGIYQQDDRDIRDERQAQGVEPAYSFMIRVRTPGGMDRIADEHGNGTFKITTRATFQFHGPSIQEINKVLLDTLAAFLRLVECYLFRYSFLSRLHAQVYGFAKLVSAHLLPRTTAYHEIWLDKKMVAGEAVKDFEPLYGEFYLPRKFKVAVAVPPTNDVDVFANDLGFIAIVDEQGELAGFNVTIGGGMGVTHGNKKTYPRVADVIGFCTVQEGPIVAEKVVLTARQRRKNARLKYTIDRMGLDAFKAEVESRLGYPLAPARPYTFDRNIDDFGWSTGDDGRHHAMLFIENGRIQDEPGRDFKTGLREIAKIHKGTFRLTANQHIMVSEISTEDVPEIKRILAKYKLDNLNHTGLRLSSSACVAFPTCGLAMAESERYLPLLIDKVEKICEENGLRNDSIVMRMTGCPTRFTGKTVSEPEILAILEPMIKRYALERNEGEHFGDFVIRAGYISLTTSGKRVYREAAAAA